MVDGAAGPLSLPGDPLELDADARAADAMLGRGPFPRVQSPDGAAPIDPLLATEASARFGFDFSGVHIRTGAAADARARQLDTRAFAEGSQISFAHGMFAPHTPEGSLLLAHELAHVMQAAEGARGTFRDPQPAPAIGQATLAVTMLGLHVQPPRGARYPAGSRIRARLRWLIGRLTGAESDDLANRAFAYLDATLPGGLELNNQADSTAADTEVATEIIAGPEVALRLIEWLEAQGHAVALAPERRRLLQSAQTANTAWDLWKSQTFAAAAAADPPWYLRHVFLSQVSRHGAALERVGQAIQAQRSSPSPTNAAALGTALRALMTELHGPIAVVEAIRLDSALTGEVGYMVLFERGAPRPHSLNAFLGYADTQPQQVQAALADSQARRTLLSNFLGFVRFGLVGRTAGDQTISQTPGRANLPALDARMEVAPPLLTPYRGARGGEYTFVVQLAFPDVFEAFAGYAYRWEVVRAPSTPGSFDASRAAGARPSAWDLARERLARAERYHHADLERLQRTLGPAAIGVRDLVTANAVLRYGGALLRTFLEQTTRARNEQTIVFDQQGLYVVRVRAVPLNQGGAFTRAASVAYMPVFIEDTAVVAQRDAAAQVGEDQRIAARITELRTQLAAAASFVGRPEAEAELARLEASMGSLGVTLQAQLDAALARRRDVPDGSREARGLDREIEQLRQRLQMRTTRFGASVPMVFRVFGTFVADTGNVVRLLLEVARLTSGEYLVSDITTPRSSMARRSGERQPAILEAVREILEGHAGYGRGHASIVIDGRTHNLRIEASLGSILSETVENATTALSVALIAAAPFTGGASLALMVPVGIVGAVPAAYRLIQRGIDGTLRLDLASAMDIVNIVGSVVGLGQVAASTRIVWLGRALMITGIGLDGANMILMGAGVVEQIAELEGLPPGLRRARLLEIMGQTMLNVGISVGGALAHRAVEARQAAGASASTPGAPGSTPAPPAAADPGRVQRMRGALPPELRSVPIVENPNLAGNTVRVVYERGRMQLEIGPSARTARVAAHANTMLFLRRFEGVIGSIRRLIDAALTRLRLHPGYGTEGFEARAEVRKLREIIGRLEATHESTTRRVSALGGDPQLAGAAIRREIAALESQVRAHEAQINSFEPGRGFIASGDTTAPPPRSGAERRAAAPAAESPPPSRPIEQMPLAEGLAHANSLPAPADRLAALRRVRAARETARAELNRQLQNLQGRLTGLRARAEELRRAPGREGLERRREQGPRVQENIRALEAEVARVEGEVGRIRAEERAITPHEDRANLLANPAEQARLPCFAPDTLVATPTGFEPIATIGVGEFVIAWSEARREAVPRLVRAVHRGLTRTWIHVTAGGTTVRATRAHRFLLTDARGFRPAHELRVGDRLQLADGEVTAVEQVREERLELEQPTCNLTVETDETYAVGIGVVVHNTPVANLGMGSFIVYIGRNPAYPNCVYVGITEPPLRGPGARESQHHDSSRRKVNELRAKQARQGGRLSAADQNALRIYEFRQGMRLEELIVGIKNRDHARYLEHQNIRNAQIQYGEDGVMNLRIEEVSTTRRRQSSGEMASELDLLERAIRNDPDVRAAGLCP